MLQNFKNMRHIIVEPHPQEYTGYPFVALVQHKQTSYIAIIDNVSEKHIKAYVLDLCEPEGLSEKAVIDLAAEWYDDSVTKYPISVEFSKRGVSNVVGKIYRTFNLDAVVRIIGHVSYFPIDEVYKVKRRKKREIQRSIAIIPKTSTDIV
jgi:hypothetical protein